MRKKTIDEIAQGAADLSSSCSDLLEYFNSSTGGGSVQFDVTKIINGTDASYSDCMSRILAITEVVEKFEKSSNHLMVPLNRLAQMKQAVVELQKHLDALSNNFKQVSKSGGGLKVFNYDNFHLQTENGQNHDMRPVFKNFYDGTEALLEAFYRILIILRPTKTTYSFQAAANALSKLIGDTSADIENLHSENQALRQAASESAEMAKQAKASAAEATRLKEESAKERKTIGEYLADATDKKASIDSVQSSASSLKKQVLEYTEEFKAFDRQLSERNEDFETGTKDQAELFEKFNNYKGSVEGLIQQSERMLKGATVAGLATSFSNAHRDLGKQLFWARASFYMGIIFLFLSAIPLMIFVFMPVIEPLLKFKFPELNDISISSFSNQQITGWQYVGQVLARFVILVPAAWFVSFSAIRHSSLFRLREHYAYKYSMAVSVEGFKKQAHGYESEIAALVLEQLAFNPADKLMHSKDIREGKAPHPMLDLLVNKFRSGLNKTAE